MFASESWRKRSLFKRIVDSRRFDKELADAHSNAAEDLGNERRVRQTGHLRLEVCVETFSVDVTEGGDWRRSGEATRQRLLRATEHSEIVTVLKRLFSSSYVFFRPYRN